MTELRHKASLGGFLFALRQQSNEGAEERRPAIEAALFEPRPRPRRFGRFIELGPIGRGGMGEVYEAYDPDLDRRVAIKLVRRDMTRHYRRLEREAKALARLQHPNVVQIYEVGHLDGDLFLAMELVQGDTLHAWQQEPHSWRECLEAYLDAGRGLAAAHDAGLVHRDFKPANCIRDASGRVRVLDLGLARAAEGPDETDRPSERSGVIESGDASVIHERLTETGSLVGTRAYMAPECFHGQASDRSDQYSFCVALYQALCGRLPFADEAQRAHGASRRVLPPPPGRSVPRWLLRALERGLHEDPARRWPSMHALLDVLERGKGRRARVGFASIVAPALVGLAVGLGWPSAAEVPCEEPDELLVGTWDEALRTRSREGLLATGSSHAMDTWMRVEPMLDRYAGEWARATADACNTSRMHREPQSGLERQQTCLRRGGLALRTTVELFASADEETVEGAVYSVDALPSIERCIGLEIDAPEPTRPPEVEQELEELRDDLQLARTLELVGQYPRALENVERVLPRAEALADRLLLAEAWRIKGQIELSAGDHQHAEASLRRAYAEATGAGRLEVELEALTGLIYVLGVAGIDTRAALELGTRPHALLADRLVIQEVGEVRAAEVFTTVAQVLTTRGELEPARAGYERALALLSDGPQDRLLARVRPLEGLAQLERREGHSDRAVALFRQAVEIREQRLGPRHPATAHSLVGLCGALIEPSVAEAESRCQQAIDIFAEQHPPDEGWLGHAHHDLALVLRQRQKLPEATAELERAIEMLAQASRPDVSPELAEARFDLGRVLEQRGLAERAIGEYEAVIEIASTEGATPANRQLAARAWSHLGDLERARGRAAQAEHAQCRALELYAEAPQAGDVEVPRAHALRRLAEALVDQGRGAAAKGVIEHALTIYAASEVSPAAVAKAQRLRAELPGLLQASDRVALDHPPCQ